MAKAGDIGSIEKEIGDRLKQARQRMGLKQEEAGEKAGTNASSISRYERGKQIPGVLVLARMAQVYGRPVEWFIEGDAGVGKNAIGELTEGQMEFFDLAQSLSGDGLSLARGLICEILNYEGHQSERRQASR